MCLNKHKIDIKACFVNEFSPSVLSVDCNRCASCNFRCYYSYIVRNWFEYEVISSASDGSAFAVVETLTYREDSLPKFQGLPCFSAKHITDFIKRLREYWRRRLGRPLRFSYMVVCEYGGNHARPHYHPVFYVLDPIGKIDFMKSVAECWQHGSTNYLSEYGRPRVKYALDHVLTSFAAVRYTLKYLFKYHDFENTCKNVLDTLESRYSIEASDRLRHDFMYECRPFIRTSVGFGYRTDLIPDITVRDFVQVPTADGFQKLPLPSYIIRKLCTEKVVVLDEFGFPVMRPNGKPEYLKTENGSYVFMRTPLGVEYSVSRLNDMISEHSKRVYQVLQLFPDYIRRTFYAFLDGRSVRQLSIYACVYRGRLYSRTDTLFVVDLFAVDFFTDFYRKCMSRNPQTAVPFDSKLGLFGDFQFLDENSVYDFRDFDLLLDALDLQSYIIDHYNDKQSPLLDSFRRVHDAFFINH